MAVTVGTSCEVKESVAQITIISSARVPVAERQVIVQIEVGAYDSDGKLVGTTSPIGMPIFSNFSDLKDKIYTYHDPDGTAHPLTGAQLAEALSVAAYRMRADEIIRTSEPTPTPAPIEPTVPEYTPDPGQITPTEPTPDPGSGPGSGSTPGPTAPT